MSIGIALLHVTAHACRIANVSRSRIMFNALPSQKRAPQPHAQQRNDNGPHGNQLTQRLPLSAAALPADGD
ncbi:hypothetical protein [Granulicella aggregans]|uniref:hypothetical protein n=1 Tax=Granulicella aggregans TaxID=474949 RepID=UPI0021E074F8|nr:hypothetical protein [Granulicella aggregans]